MCLFACLLYPFNVLCKSTMCLFTWSSNQCPGTVRLRLRDDIHTVAVHPDMGSYGSCPVFPSTSRRVIHPSIQAECRPTCFKIQSAARETAVHTPPITISNAHSKPPLVATGRRDLHRDAFIRTTQLVAIILDLPSWGVLSPAIHLPKTTRAPTPWLFSRCDAMRPPRRSVVYSTYWTATMCGVDFSARHPVPNRPSTSSQPGEYSPVQ
ncbi:hypothetical protein BJ875DRAFT_127566 [Amylocarpus encephaloides]|uniref:Secreted protein n=1 Tax=Amylocarpus encephaloides TaxID=45428 RepID=A0A9P8C290_9HELO|nr:hypothetical protein BJ875DRAFT_127566 [Amylocarpus encephaloides]